MGFIESSGTQMLLPSLMGAVCACSSLYTHGFVYFLCIFNIFRTPHMTGINEAKNLTLNSRKGSLLPLPFVQKYLFSNTSGVKMLWADVFHLWNAKFWNYPKIHGATSRNWGFLPADVSRMFWQMSLKKKQTAKFSSSSSKKLLLF